MTNEFAKNFKKSLEGLSEDEAKQKLEELASSMYNPIRCGGAGYDENGKYYLILGGKRCNAREINQIKREMNPTWSEENLKPYLLDEDK